MVSRRLFTIIELLIAITITVVCVNLLSTLYVRANTVALAQAELMAISRDGVISLEIIQGQLKDMIIPISDSGSSGVRYPIYMGNIMKDGTTEKYPGIVFHRQAPPQETGSKSTAFGIEQVALFLAPPLAGFAKSPYLEFCKVTNSNYNRVSETFNNTLFIPQANANAIPAAAYDGREVLLENVVGLSFEAKFFDGTGFDTSELLFEDESHTIESLSFCLTKAPESLKIELLGTSSLLDSMTKVDDFTRENGFFFQDQGFIANRNNGEVYRYKRSGDTDIDVWSAYGSACANDNEGWCTGFTFQRHFNIR